MVRRFSIQLLLQFCGLLLWSLVLVAPCMAQESISGLGIFDATAIWESSKDSSQKEKSVGFVGISRFENSFFYDLFGKGKNWDSFLRDGKSVNYLDEGFLVYTERPGSWMLSARVELDFQKSYSELLHTIFGVIIRERADDSTSAFYAAFSRAQFWGNTVVYGLSPIWRSHRSEGSVPLKRESNLLYCSLASLNSVYLRITRIVSQDLFYTEWSIDGETWNVLHRMTLAMRGSVAYGFFVTGNEFVSIPAHVRISDISINSPSYYAERAIVSDSFYPGDTHEVLIKLRNFKPETQRFTIQEHLPEGWMADPISGGGTIDNGTITWSLSAEPGDTTLRYLLHSPVNTNEDLSLTGSMNGTETQGDHYLRKLRMEERAYLSLSNQWMIIIAIPIVMLLMHLVLFLLAPAMKEHLFYSIYLGNAAFSSYTFYLYCIHYIAPIDHILCSISWSFTATLLILFLYSLTYRRIPYHFYFFLMGSIVFSIWAIFTVSFRYFDSPYYVSGLITFLFVGYLECLRIVMKELLTSKEGSLIIMIGVLFYVLICLWSFFSALNLIPSPLVLTGINRINDWLHILFFLSVSIYLSYRFAKTHRELELVNVELENRVEQRTHELEHANEELDTANQYLNNANSELQEANAQLIQLDQMKTQFVSQASHDLRTPLTAIKGSLDNLLMGIAGALSEKQAKIMTRATTSVDRLTNLINDVLDLNRIETGRIVLEKTDMPFKALVENIINENRPAAEQKQIMLNANLGDEISLLIDGSKIERVIGELISNALKYTPDNGTVDVCLSHEDDTASLSVKDSGIGMTPEECEKIWERFYRTSASKKFAKGSGLGLSIAKELVELHKGTLEVDSEQGKHTTFLLQLPTQGEENES